MFKARRHIVSLLRGIRAARSRGRYGDPLQGQRKDIDERQVCFFGESLFAFLMKPMLPLSWFSRAEGVIVKKDMPHCLETFRNALTRFFLLLVSDSTQPSCTSSSFDRGKFTSTPSRKINRVAKSRLSKSA